MHTDYLTLLRLMQLADSALPVGATAHSFGLETLGSEEYLEVQQLGAFLKDYLEEAGVVEGAFCCLGYRLSSHTDLALFTAQWLALNERLSAIKTSRESRAASTALGRRFLQLIFPFRVLASSVQESFAPPPTSLQSLVVAKILRSAPPCSSTRALSGCQPPQPRASPL